MSTQVTQDATEQHKSEYVQIGEEKWATVWADHIEDTNVWITEHVVDEPNGATAPHTVRGTWKVHKVNQNHWIVSSAGEKRMFNGCANGRRESTFDAHRNKLETELKHHYLLEGNSSSTEFLTIEFKD